MRSRTALELILSVIPVVRPLVARLRYVERNLADRLRRAVTSIALDLAEADGNRLGNRRLRLLTAHGSANEAKVALRIAVAGGYVERHDVDQPMAVIDRVGAMTWSRLRSQ